MYSGLAVTELPDLLHVAHEFVPVSGRKRDKADDIARLDAQPGKRAEIPRVRPKEKTYLSLPTSQYPKPSAVGRTCTMFDTAIGGASGRRCRSPK